MMKVPASDIAHFLCSLATRVVSSRFELHSSVMQSRQIIEIVLSAVATFKHIFIKWSSSRNTPHSAHHRTASQSFDAARVYLRARRETDLEGFSALPLTQDCSVVFWDEIHEYPNAHLRSLENNVEVGKEKYSRRQSFAVFGYHLFAFSFSFAKKAFLF